ncbi:MAG: hypothetical protein G01um101420_154 [Parcubacteria group bacterium Gr01-1014_20]|nr:MAG: hypothetical protein G01um101420_154 [Parcubacteria group bacterium Gr01-1014_20]
MKKGEITVKILEFIFKTAETSFDIFNAILSSGYGASYSEMGYRLRQNERKRSIEETKRQRTQNYHNILYKLKKDGLILEAKKDGKKVIAITPKGKAKLANLRDILSKNRKIPSAHYKKESQPFFTIVVFDIPEKERRSRDWLREVLKNLGLEMIQKSVWIGKIKIPKELASDIFKLKLENYVEIFQISKTGSLKHLT